MSFYKFDKNDIILNSARSYPEKRVYIDHSASYFDNSGVSGSKPIPHISGSKLIIEKQSYTARPLFIPEAEFVTSSATASFEKDYYLSSSIQVASDYLAAGSGDNKLPALKNTLNYHKRLSPHYAYSSSLGDKPQQDLTLVSIPSLLYGSSIEPGSVNLKFYVTGNVAGTLTDSSKRGELVQQGGTDDGKVAGVVLYDEGFLLLTGSWALNTTQQAYPPGALDFARWKYFGTKDTLLDSTFDISFNGTTYTPTMTMFASAPRGGVNSSNNPTFVEYGQPKVSSTSSYLYLENDEQQIKNVVSSSFQDTGSFEKTVYISSVGIYDDDMNLVGTAKLANPIRKREKDSYTFKLKLDL
jgi:hypothetical protein|tara:strand:+ start:170 stop:1234 length:1065 start_codon:yes stop_codon:yes gene_type:complete